MQQALLQVVYALRSSLHKLAERSGEEKKTKAYLMDFLRRNTSLRLEDGGNWFFAIHAEPGAGETIAFRADMDALPSGEGAAHLCGHDGHCAVLAGLGLLVEKKKLGRNMVLVFQHAEEAAGLAAPRKFPLHKVQDSRPAATDAAEPISPLHPGCRTAMTFL